MTTLLPLAGAEVTRRPALATLRCPDLPRLDDLAVVEVRDHGLIDPKAASRTLDAAEARRHSAGDDDTGHLYVAVDHDLLHVVVEVGHGV